MTSASSGTNWRIRVEPYVRGLFKAWWRLSRGMTLGVRGIVEREDGAILLVRHTYLPGWHLPGGGVEGGETAHAALEREIAEEAGIALEGAAELVGIYSNHKNFRGDHVIVYRVRVWRTCTPDSDGEIEAVEWFHPDALPRGISAATRRRVEELLGQRETDGIW